MAFSKKFKQYVLDHSSIEIVIGNCISLKRIASSPHEYIGLCPFHKEKTPSFTVTFRKQFFHCFGCGSYGRSHDFIRRYMGVTNVVAFMLIADQFNIPLPKIKTITQVLKIQREKEKKKATETRIWKRRRREIKKEHPEDYLFD